MILRALDTLAAIAAGTLLLIVSSGGATFTFGSLNLGLHDPLRPGIIFVCATLARVAASKPAAPGIYAARQGLLALLIALVGTYFQYHVRVAGGLDSYGYHSAAALLASGRLAESQPVAAVLPFEGAIDAASQLGHVPARDAAHSVPRFPLGLPAVMAVLSVFGPMGPYFVPLVLGIAALICAGLLAREAMTVAMPTGYAAATGSFAAIVVGIDPLFANYAMQQMSDVPATFWVLAACLGVIRPSGNTISTSRAAAAGACAGMAMLTRPALAPMALALVLTTLDQPRRVTLAALVPVASFGALQAVLNALMYGSPLTSGYGPTGHMFDLSLARMAATAGNFGRWLTYSHTPLVWLVWPGAMLVLRRHRWAWKLSAVAAAAMGPYLFYLVFNDWESARFLLPGLALVLVLGACAAALILQPLGEARAALLLLCLAASLAAASRVYLDRADIFKLHVFEGKYRSVGEWFSSQTPDNAVVLSSLHSGSIRLYGGRTTLRFDRIPADALGATVRSLKDAGYEPYVALDMPSEPPMFVERFGSLEALEQIARVRVVNIYRFVSAE